MRVCQWKLRGFFFTALYPLRNPDPVAVNDFLSDQQYSGTWKWKGLCFYALKQKDIAELFQNPGAVAQNFHVKVKWHAHTHTHMHTHTHTHTHTCTHTRAHTHRYMHTHTRARTHTHTHTCTHTHAHTRTRTRTHTHAHAHTHISYQMIFQIKSVCYCQYRIFNSACLFPLFLYKIAFQVILNSINLKTIQ